MLVIGLTGSFGSGKSTVARLLRDLGAVVLDADAVGHEALSQGSEAWTEVVAAFGRGVLSLDNSVDRKKLADIVFNDAAAREKLNGIMHPRMFETVRRRLDRWRQEGMKVAVLEATLLIEAGWTRLVDQVWVVVAPEKQVVERVGKGGVFSGAQVGPRWKSQLPAAEKAGRADAVIDNSGSLKELSEKVRLLWRTRVEPRQRGASAGG